jgi:hypothetical protein
MGRVARIKSMGFSPPVFSLAGAIHDVLRFRPPGGLVRLLHPGLLFVAEFVDGADRHHHDLDLRAGGEVAHLAQLGRVVEEEVEGRARVEPLQMIGGGLKGVIDAFLDRHRGHHDDEFGEAEASVQLEDGAQIDVGLARAGLHLHGEVAGREPGRGRQSMSELDGVQVSQQLIVEQRQPVADAEVAFEQ